MISGSPDLFQLPKMTAKPGTSIRYAAVPSERFPAGSTPAEITRHSMDSSFQVCVRQYTTGLK